MQKCNLDFSVLKFKKQIKIQDQDLLTFLVFVLYHGFIIYIYIYEVNVAKCNSWNEIWHWTKDEIETGVAGSCRKLAVSVSWTLGLIAQSSRASEQNSVVVGSNSTQTNFL